MRRKVAVFFIHISLIICTICFMLAKYEKVYRYIEKKISSYKEIQNSEFRHANLDKINELPSLIDDNEAWYSKYHFIAHSGGAIDGKLFSDSLEAWELSYENGNRIYDADISLTSDGQYVLRHSWIDNMEQGELPHYKSESILDGNGVWQYWDQQVYNYTYEEFMSTPIYNKYTPMSLEDMIAFMISHDDIYVAIDMKVDNVVAGYKHLVSSIKDSGNDELLERIIVSLYDYTSLEQIKKVYPFENAMMRQMYVHPNNYYELAKYCIENDIHVVNLSASFADDIGVQYLESKGIQVWIAVVDYISDMQIYVGNGASGAVTNYLYESDWDYIIH